jgi:hypothetical protein
VPSLAHFEGEERKVNRKARRALAALGRKDRKRTSVWKPGHCYHNAYLWLLYRPELSDDHFLVHGLVYHEQTGRHGHAWIETTIAGVEFVYDKGDYMPKVLYYQLGDVSYTVRYSLKQSSILAVETGHSGPWDETILNAA